jgi:DNA-binding transcriptional LysR family regulator
MDIEYIKRFITVGQCLNFSQAADKLFITQPTLSHSINILERQLGTRLLVRNTRYVNLTRAGKLFLPAAIEIVERYQNVVNKIYQELGLGDDLLKLGYVGSVSDRKFSIWVKKFRKVYPDVKLHVQRYISTSIGDAFENHLIHLAILYKNTADLIPGLKYQELYSEKFRVIVNAEHPLASRSEIDLAMLKDEPFLICERSFSPCYYDQVLEICERRGLKPMILQTVSTVGDIYRLIDAGLGVALMSYSDTRSYASYNVRFISIGDAEDLKNTVVIAWMGNLTPAARQFKDIVEKHVYLSD